MPAMQAKYLKDLLFFITESIFSNTVAIYSQDLLIGIKTMPTERTILLNQFPFNIKKNYFVKNQIKHFMSKILFPYLSSHKIFS